MTCPSWWPPLQTVLVVSCDCGSDHWCSRAAVCAGSPQKGRDSPQLKVDGQVPFAVEAGVGRVASQPLHTGLRAALTLKLADELHAQAVPLQQSDR